MKRSSSASSCRTRFTSSLHAGYSARSQARRHLAAASETSCTMQRGARGGVKVSNSPVVLLWCPCYCNVTQLQQAGALR